jgi:hypothetical protein
MLFCGKPYGEWGPPPTWSVGRPATSMHAPPTWPHLCRPPSCAKEGCCMTPEELRRDEANRWLASARKDLSAARILAAEPTAVFHSQQAAEKAAKAFLAFHNVPFRKVLEFSVEIQKSNNQPGGMARCFSMIASASSSDSVVPTSIHPLGTCSLRNASAFMYFGQARVS